MIEVKNKQILIDGKPQVIISGEIHYFRLDRDDWQRRIDLLKEAGCNAVASYIPWLVHEMEEGKCDLDGSTKPELDLGAFIDLCKENGLMFFARPGPFVMAELKNEGLPYWVAEKHPDIVPVSWQGKKVTTATLDYLHPDFLQECREWYAKVMKIIAPRTASRGGNVVGVQLDNEIGMLSWVSKMPDLTDNVLEDFSGWLKKRYIPQELTARYPFDLDDPAGRAASIRNPQEDYALPLMKDLGHYMRNRFARYVEELDSYARENGVDDIPFIVNIHGTSDGRGLTFPIGISQLYESYSGKANYLSGSDIYLNNLTIDNFQDLYILNAFMAAVHGKDQPITSMEFQCGDGNYGQTYGNRIAPYSADFKVRMCIAQGARWINYYLFSGGKNHRLDKPVRDGNGRFANTSELHDLSAPVSPEGKKSYVYDRLSQVTHTMNAVADKITTMEEQHDNVTLGFIPDYFMTETSFHGSPSMNRMVRNLEENRGSWAWELMARAMLMGGFRFGAADIQNRDLDVKTTPVMALASAKYMDSAVQKKIAQWLQDGGKLLMYGEVPLYDMEGNPCTILADALDVRYKETHFNGEHGYLSISAENWAAPRWEVRSNHAHVYESATATPILRTYQDNEMCGFETKVGRGSAIVVGTSYVCDVDFYKQALERLGATPALQHDCEHQGVFMTSTANDEGERFLHIMNFDSFDKSIHITEDGQPLFDGREIEVPTLTGLMLPLNVRFNHAAIVSSTAELKEVLPDGFRFRLTQFQDEIVLDTDKKIVPDKDFEVKSENGLTRIISRKHAKVNDTLTVRFA